MNALIIISTLFAVASAQNPDASTKYAISTDSASECSAERGAEQCSRCPSVANAFVARDGPAGLFDVSATFQCDADGSNVSVAEWGLLFAYKGFGSVSRICQIGSGFVEGVGSDSDTCVQCEVGCAYCTAASVCKKAMEGYYLGPSNFPTACTSTTNEQCKWETTNKIGVTAAQLCPFYNSFDSLEEAAAAYVAGTATRVDLARNHVYDGVCDVCAVNSSAYAVGVAGCAVCPTVANAHSRTTYTCPAVVEVTTGGSPSATVRVSVEDPTYEAVPGVGPNVYAKDAGVITTMAVAGGDASFCSSADSVCNGQTASCKALCVKLTGTWSAPGTQDACELDSTGLVATGNRWLTANTDSMCQRGYKFTAAHSGFEIQACSAAGLATKALCLAPGTCTTNATNVVDVNITTKTACLAAATAHTWAATNTWAACTSRTLPSVDCDKYIASRNPVCTPCADSNCEECATTFTEPLEPADNSAWLTDIADAAARAASLDACSDVDVGTCSQVVTAGGEFAKCLTAGVCTTTADSTTVQNVSEATCVSSGTCTTNGAHDNNKAACTAAGLTFVHAKTWAPATWTLPTAATCVDHCSLGGVVQTTTYTNTNAPGVMVQAECISQCTNVCLSDYGNSINTFLNNTSAHCAAAGGFWATARTCSDIAHTTETTCRAASMSNTWGFHGREWKANAGTWQGECTVAAPNYKIFGTRLVQPIAGNCLDTTSPAAVGVAHVTSTNQTCGIVHVPVQANYCELNNAAAKIINTVADYCMDQVNMWLVQTECGTCPVGSAPDGRVGFCSDDFDRTNGACTTASSDANQKYTTADAKGSCSVPATLTFGSYVTQATCTANAGTWTLDTAGKCNNTGTALTTAATCTAVGVCTVSNLVDASKTTETACVAAAVNGVWAQTWVWTPATAVSYGCVDCGTIANVNTDATDPTIVSCTVEDVSAVSTDHATITFADNTTWASGGVQLGSKTIANNGTVDVCAAGFTLKAAAPETCREPLNPGVSSALHTTQNTECEARLTDWAATQKAHYELARCSIKHTCEGDASITTQAACEDAATKCSTFGTNTKNACEALTPAGVWTTRAWTVATEANCTGAWNQYCEDYATVSAIDAKTAAAAGTRAAAYCSDPTKTTLGTCVDSCSNGAATTQTACNGLATPGTWTPRTWFLNRTTSTCVSTCSSDTATATFATDALCTGIFTLRRWAKLESPAAFCASKVKYSGDDGDAAPFDSVSAGCVYTAPTDDACVACADANCAVCDAVTGPLDDANNIPMAGDCTVPMPGFYLNNGNAEACVAMTWSQCMTSGHTVGITLATNGTTESVSATDTAEYLNRAPIPLADLCTNVVAAATEQITAATGCMAYEFSCALLSEAEEARITAHFNALVGLGASCIDLENEKLVAGVRNYLESNGIDLTTEQSLVAVNELMNIDRDNSLCRDEFTLFFQDTCASVYGADSCHVPPLAAVVSPASVATPGLVLAAVAFVAMIA